MGSLIKLCTKRPLDPQVSKLIYWSVAKNFRAKDDKYLLPLEIAAGAKLDQILVDNDRIGSYLIDTKNDIL